jgi:serine/threonine protein kinase HipA of HipAB toxin-antitoxin module
MITPWLRGLLPVNDALLRRWAREFHVSAWNWLIGGTDAHAKNYSLLLAGDQSSMTQCHRPKMKSK